MENNIGQRIQQRRKELHITQTQIQKETHISSGNLSGIENGRYLPSAVALIELARVLDCSIDWILTGSSLKSNISGPPCDELSEPEHMLLHYFHGMSDEDKEELLMIAQIKYNKKNRITTKSNNL